MPRKCRSWRYHQVPGHDGHDRPGGCRECWTPCTAPIGREEWSDGVRRCSECERSLLHCREVTVRRALVTDPLVTRQTLEALRSDPSGPVSMAADMALFELDQQGKDSGVVPLAGSVETRLRRREMRR